MQAMASSDSTPDQMAALSARLDALIAALPDPEPEPDPVAELAAKIEQLEAALSKPDAADPEPELSLVERLLDGMSADDIRELREALTGDAAADAKPEAEAKPETTESAAAAATLIGSGQSAATNPAADIDKMDDDDVNKWYDDLLRSEGITPQVLEADRPIAAANSTT